MNLTYSGQKEPFSGEERKKIGARIAKLGKLVERKGEKVAHAAFTATRHLRKAEVTMNFRDHPVAGVGTGAREFQALIEAVDRAEKQILKLREKLRDGKRGAVARKAKEEAPAGAPESSGNSDGGPAPSVKVFRVRAGTGKPITLDEAMLEMTGGNGSRDRAGSRDYIAYRDAERGALSVLVRRKDGHFDLIEA